jgi:hypothetical protein
MKKAHWKRKEITSTWPRSLRLTSKQTLLVPAKKKETNHYLTTKWSNGIWEEI